MDSTRYLDLFLAESREQLHALNRALFALEGGSPAALDEAFRAAHSLKGMSGAMGFEEVVALTHALEDELSVLRDGALPPPAETVDHLLAGAESLEAAVARALASAEGSADGDGDEPNAGARAGAPPPADDRPSRPLRVDPARVDALVEDLGELAVLQSRLTGELDAAGATQAGAFAGLLAQRAAGLAEATMGFRRVPAGRALSHLRHAVARAARAAGKRIEFRMEGEALEIDGVMLEELEDPLIHLLRNAVDHGVETPSERKAAGKRIAGRVTLRVARGGSGVSLEVEDDGRGIDGDRVRALAGPQALDAAVAGAADDEDAQLLALLSVPGFSTAEQVTDLSGRGVGLDVVTERIRRLGGTVGLRTEPGKGTAVTLKVPVDFAIIQALWIMVGPERYAVPLVGVAEIVDLDRKAARRGKPGRFRHLRLAEVLGCDAPKDESLALIVGSGRNRTALAVHGVEGSGPAVVRSVDAARNALPCFSGVALRGDGRPVLVLDPTSFL